MELLVLNKPRIDFSICFKDFISRYREPLYNPYAYGYSADWDYWDDDCWDDTDYLSYLRGEYDFGSTCASSRFNKNFGVHRHNSSSSKHTKLTRHKRGKKHKSSSKSSTPLYSSSTVDINSTDSLFGMNDKEIYFYPDINNPDSYEYFDSLLRFDDYLTSMGIEISDYEVQKILNRDISHCCSYNNSGKCQLLSDHSYSGLYYEMCDEINSNDSFWN